MTEQEWLVSKDPAKMLQYLWQYVTYDEPTYGGTTTRWRLPPLVSERKLRLWCWALFKMSSHKYKYHQMFDWSNGEEEEGEPSVTLTARKWANADYDHSGDPPIAVRAEMLREIVGNPWNPIILRSECQGCRGTGDETSDGQGRCGSCKGKGKAVSRWLTPTVLNIAQAAYDSSDFGNLPILADALEDVGCDEEELLKHLRGGTRHVRGCWVLDLLLGKQ
jgi:hypothetical protein